MNLKKMLEISGKQVIGSYTTFYRAQMEPYLVSSRKADIATMELLGFSKINPLYLFEKIKDFYNTSIKDSSKYETLSAELAFFSHEGPFPKK